MYSSSDSPFEQTAVTALIAALRGEDTAMRNLAASVLDAAALSIGPREKEAIPALVDAVKYSFPHVRIRAFNWLARLGREGKAALPAVIEALMDPDPGVRKAAADALAAIAPDASKAVPALPPAANSGAGGAQGKETAAAPAPTDDVAKSVAVFRGKVVILCFWAAARCEPCRLQMTEFVSLQNKYRNQSVEIVGVSIDRLTGHTDDRTVVAFMKDNGINYSIFVVIEAAALAGYDVSKGIPATFLLDRAGRTVKSYVGRIPLLTFEEDLKKLLP